MIMAICVGMRLVFSSQSDTRLAINLFQYLSNIIIGCNVKTHSCDDEVLITGDSRSHPFVDAPRLDCDLWCSHPMCRAWLLAASIAVRSTHWWLQQCVRCRILRLQTRADCKRIWRHTFRVNELGLAAAVQ